MKRLVDLDQRAFPGNTSLPHSLHLALKVIEISNQSVIAIIISFEVAKKSIYMSQ
jgi:hypothetical protein